MSPSMIVINHHHQRVIWETKYLMSKTRWRKESNSREKSRPKRLINDYLILKQITYVIRTQNFCLKRNSPLFSWSQIWYLMFQVVPLIFLMRFEELPILFCFSQQYSFKAMGVERAKIWIMSSYNIVKSKAMVIWPHWKWMLLL